MAWSGGVFSRIHNWVNDYNAAIGIDPTRHDAEDDNLRDGINACIAKDGTNAFTGDVDAGGNNVVNVAAGSSATDASTIGGTETLTNKTIVAASNTITTAASGNLVATGLNAALAELQTDIDTRSLSSHNHSGTYEPADATILKDADIGSTVQAYNATTVLDADVTYGLLDTNGDVGTGAGQLAIGNHNHSGVYEPADATILKDADISSTVQAYSATNTLDADVTYGLLNTNGDVGTGAGQLAIGNHTHDSITDTNLVDKSAAETITGIWDFNADKLKVNGSIVREFRGAYVTDSANQSLTTGVQASIDFNSESYDTDTIHDNATNNQRLTVPSGTTYARVSASVEYANNATGIRTVDIYVDNTTRVSWQIEHSPASSDNTIVRTTTDWILTSGVTYFNVRAYQNSGGALDIVHGNPGGTYFSIEFK